MCLICRGIEADRGDDEDGFRSFDETDIKLRHFRLRGVLDPTSTRDPQIKKIESKIHGLANECVYLLREIERDRQANQTEQERWSQRTSFVSFFSL